MHLLKVNVLKLMRNINLCKYQPLKRYVIKNKVTYDSDSDYPNNCWQTNVILI